MNWTISEFRDEAGVIAPVLSDGAASYTPGISEKRSGTTTYTHSGFKSGESHTGSGQTVLVTKTFDAFGNLDTSSGTWKGPFGPVAPADLLIVVPPRGPTKEGLSGYLPDRNQGIHDS